MAADVNENSSKLVKARKLGIKILSLAEFLEEPLPEKSGAEPPVPQEEESDLFSLPPATPEKKSPPQEEEQLELF